MMSKSQISDDLKVKYLERLVRNLYHGKSIEWYVHPERKEDWDGDPNHLWGWIQVSDINSPDEVPKLFDCCDSGLSQDIDSEAVPDEEHVIKELPPYRVQHNVAIYFDFDSQQEIKNLRAKITELVAVKPKEILGN
jgi:hypothetical protein